MEYCLKRGEKTDDFTYFRPTKIAIVLVKYHVNCVCTQFIWWSFVTFKEISFCFCFILQQIQYKCFSCVACTHTHFLLNNFRDYCYSNTRIQHSVDIEHRISHSSTINQATYTTFSSPQHTNRTKW